MRERYFSNEDEFLIDGVPVLIGDTRWWGGAYGRIKSLVWIAEQVFHRRLLHEKDVHSILHRHYRDSDQEDLWRRLRNAEWAYQSQYTAYMTLRQLVRVLPKRRRCEYCNRKAQYFTSYVVGATPWRVRDDRFCCFVCQKKFKRREVRRYESEIKRRKHQWKQIQLAKQKLRAVRKWLRTPSDRDPSLFPNEESRPQTISRD